jgi:hypothetical protein
MSNYLVHTTHFMYVQSQKIGTWHIFNFVDLIWLFLRLFYWILKLFRQCGIYFVFLKLYLHLQNLWLISYSKLYNYVLVNEWKNNEYVIGWNNNVIMTSKLSSVFFCIVYWYSIVIYWWTCDTTLLDIDWSNFDQDEHVIPPSLRYWLIKFWPGF